jgi:ATP-binding cassette, subfamily C (CFTR/MRP), member 1
MRQLKRLNAVSKSPIFNYFSETLTGLSTIRAYKCQERFIDEMTTKTNYHLSFFYPDTILLRWLAVRIQFIGSLITLLACLFGVFLRDSLTDSIVGLSISYSLNISSMLNYLLRMTSDFETSITSVERINEYCSSDQHEVLKMVLLFYIFQLKM